MAIPKYARLENERRFLVDLPLAPALDWSASSLIEDIYFSHSRLRLRRMTDAATGTVHCKLCKKYGGEDALSAPITNIYLDDLEYQMLESLPGDRVQKRRYRVNDGGLRFGVDVFEERLAGLVLAEIEMSTRRELADVVLPAWVRADVTEVEAFTGGALSRIDAVALQKLLIAT